jgi:hypothetical protein
MPDGRVQLVHKTNDASDAAQAELGILFMTDMFELSKKQNYKLQVQESDYKPMSLVLLVNAELKEYHTGIAQFGLDLRKSFGVIGRLAIAEPFDACTPLQPPGNLTDRIVLVKRGNCMFVEKARHVQKSGGIGVIVIDNAEDSSYSSSPMFAMSGDGTTDVTIPALFLFGKEGRELVLTYNFGKASDFFVFMGDNSVRNALTGVERVLTYNSVQFQSVYNPGKYHHLNKCHAIEYYFRLRQRPASTCRATDVIEFGEVYTKVFKIAEPWTTTITVQMDDVISIRYYSETKKMLVLKLDTLLAIEYSLHNETRSAGDEQKRGYDKATRIFKLLFEHFQKKTKLLKFERTGFYMKSLFNYVNFKLNPRHAKFTNEDKLNFEMLADDLDKFN